MMKVSLSLYLKLVGEDVKFTKILLYPPLTLLVLIIDSTDKQQFFIAYFPKIFVKAAVFTALLPQSLLRL